MVSEDSDRETREEIGGRAAEVRAEEGTEEQYEDDEEERGAKEAIRGDDAN